MGFWRGAGKLAWGATKLTAKAATVTTGLAVKGVAATANAIYDHREQIGSAAAMTAKVAGKATVATAKGAYKVTVVVTKALYDHREQIAGATVGAVKGTAGAVRDATGHFVSKEAIATQLRIVEKQSRQYRELISRFNMRVRAGIQSKPVLLDTLTVGGETLAAYIHGGNVPAEIQHAYELAYPNVAAARSFADEVARLDGQELVGFVSGVKGKLFELHYADYLNDGNLPDGFHAELAASPTNPGWDIAIVGPGGVMHDTIQAKATDSVAYVAAALEQNPQIDVVTTSEVHSHLVMQGFSDNVIDSGISDEALTAAVEGGIDGATTTMHWMPSAISLALIAFSAYNNEGLTAYQKSMQFGERSSKSYLAYLAGGAIAVATNTWWIGVLGGMGTRLTLGVGRKKRERLAQLKELVQTNQQVLLQLEQRLPTQAA